jgi:hypothetical protein
MNDLWNECRRSVLHHARDDADRVQKERDLCLAEPFFLLVTGERGLARADEIAPTVRLPQLSILANLKPDEPIKVVAHPWSQRGELPPAEADYSCFFSTVFLKETATAFETYGLSVYSETQGYFIQTMGDSAFDNVLCYQGQPVSSAFGADVIAAMARGLASAGTLALLYALYGDAAGLGRIAPYMRYLAQVLPVGFLVGDSSLHVLCDG